MLMMMMMMILCCITIRRKALGTMREEEQAMTEDSNGDLNNHSHSSLIVFQRFLQTRKERVATQMDRFSHFFRLCLIGLCRSFVDPFFAQAKKTEV